MRISFFLTFVLILSLIFTGDSLAQIKKGQKELSLSFTLTAIGEDDGQASGRLYLLGRFGYFFSNKLELEPEIIFSQELSSGDDHPGIMLSGNFLLHPDLPGRDLDFPFLLVGGGWAYSTNSFNNSYITESRHYPLLNLGGGLKFRLNERSALRVEFRYQRLFAKKEISPYYPYEADDRSLSALNFLIGLSLFLK